MTDAHTDPYKQKLTTQIRWFTHYLDQLGSPHPDETTYYEDAPLKDPEMSLKHVCKITIREWQQQLNEIRFLDEDAELRWLSRLKGAIRCADALINVLLDEYENELRGFAYGQVARTEAQSLWGIMQFAALELGIRIVQIETHYPTLQHYFALERAAYYAERDQSVEQTATLDTATIQ